MLGSDVFLGFFFSSFSEKGDWFVLDKTKCGHWRDGVVLKWFLGFFSFSFFGLAPSFCQKMSFNYHLLVYLG